MTNIASDKHDPEKPVLKVTTRIFWSWEGLAKALWEKSFVDLSSTDQVSKLWKLFRDHVWNDKALSEHLMSMIRSATMFATWTKILTEDELMRLSSFEVDLMWKLSKKKIAVARFERILWAHYDNLTEENKRQLLETGIDRTRFIQIKIRETYNAFKWVSNEIIDTLWNNYNLSYDVRLFLKAFNMEDIDVDDENLSEVCSCNGSSPEVFMEMWSKFPYLWINSDKIRRELMYETDEAWRLTWNYLDSLESSKNTMVDSRNGFINPNWFLYDTEVETAIKLWWPEKTKYIFWRYFRTGIEGMSFVKDSQLPSFYNFALFRIKIDEDAEWNKKKLVDIAQHIMEWEVPWDFSQEDFSELIRWLKTVISDFRSSGEPKRFDHPIQTYPGSKRYTGYFSWSKWFENTHIIDIRSLDQKWKRVLRFATELWQDTLLFVMIQISYFLKNKKLLDSSTVWRSIYEMYNSLSLEGVEKFRPDIMKDQYNTLVQKVVWPLSHEHAEIKGKIGKPHNVLMYWVYGTGKSQLLTHLLAEREYTLKNGKTVNLEANVINIWLMEFTDLLVKSASGFRKRLSDIHENTGRPIILVIEDIDTIVKEQWLESDPVSQAMTTLFEWVWSLPVTVIASTNNPEILPQRHLRPNRLDTLIGFSYPVNQDVLKQVLYAHWEKKWLDKMLQSFITLGDIEDILIDKMLNFTPSHISAVCLSIYEELEFEDLNVIWEEWIKKVIFDQIANCLVPEKDMRARDESMQKWRDSLWRNTVKMWFTNQ